MHDGLICIIRDSPDGVDSVTLAQEVLKFRNPDPRLAHHAVKSILSSDPRCRLGEDGLWRPVTPADRDDRPLEELPWSAVLLLTDPTGANQTTPVYLSAWSLNDPPRPLLSAWLVDPEGLSHEEQEVLRSPRDETYEQDREATLGRAARLLNATMPVFLSGQQQRILAYRLSCIGESLTDDSILVSQLLRLAELPPPRPIDFAGCYRALFDRAPTVSSAFSHGEGFAEIVTTLIRRLVRNGIRDRDALDARERTQTLDMDWSGKAFTPEDIASLPSSSGVYGFKDREGRFIYIGKALNLRRRLLGYFRSTEESPAKLDALRRDAYDLTIHRCGSELESLVLEHRLIRKYSPRLNKQTGVEERKGPYRPIEDCIVVMPHAQEDMLVSFWFRKNQKILLKALRADMSELDGLGGELESFFFSDRTPSSPEDFPEQEIVSRWLKRHIEQLPTVLVHRMGAVEEIIAGIRGAALELSERPSRT